MSKISRDNQKRVFNKPAPNASYDNDMLRKSDAIGAVSGDLSAANGVTLTAGAGSDDLIIGLGDVTPDSIVTPASTLTNATISELASVSGLDVTAGSAAIGNLVLADSSGNARITPNGALSGVLDLNYALTVGGAISGILGNPPLATTNTAWIRVMVGGSLKYIPVWS